MVQKRHIAVCARKIQLMSKTSATKFLFVKNSSGQLVGTSFPYPTVHRSIACDVPIYPNFAFKVTHHFRKRRFRQFSFHSASDVTASTDTFCDKNLAQRISFLAIYHLWRYSQGITRNEGVKMIIFRLRVCIRPKMSVFLFLSQFLFFSYFFLFCFSTSFQFCLFHLLFVFFPSLLFLII